jgi:hypothetical protein
LAVKVSAFAAVFGCMRSASSGHLHWLAVAALGCVAGCGSQKGSKPAQRREPPLAAAELSVTSAGGVLSMETEHGAARLVIPEGALRETTTIRMELLDPLASTTAGPLSDMQFALLPHGTRFELPVTFEFPARPGANRVLRRTGTFIPAEDPWSPARHGAVAGDRATVETRGFSLYSTAADAELDAVIAVECPIVGPTTDVEGCSWSGDCFGDARAVSVECSTSGECTCQGGALRYADFSASCEEGVASVMRAAAEACEWSPLRPNVLPTHSWWEIIPRSFDHCSAEHDNVGGYVYLGALAPDTGLPREVHVSPRWHDSAATISVNNGPFRVSAARDGTVTEFSWDVGCLRLRYAEDAPCGTPIGFVDGTPTKILLELASAQDSQDGSRSAGLQFTTNSSAEPGLAYRLNCSSHAGRPALDKCECAGHGDESWAWAGNFADGERVIAAFSAQEATEQDAKLLLAGCGWPESTLVELRTRAPGRPSSAQPIVPHTAECYGP